MEPFVSLLYAMTSACYSSVERHEVYLTIRPVALSDYGSIAHEAKPSGRLLALKGEGLNCLFGEKTKEKPPNFATRWLLVIVT